jgi:hypothetical protein
MTVAVLCWGTQAKEAASQSGKGPLTLVELRGLEPLTPCLQNTCASTGARALEAFSPASSGHAVSYVDYRSPTSPP